ncbi:hypothetical protein [Phnomibacter sp. MR]|uniref:hypothetical protein n=1 Tax=Phnomibacter sp. MR TaxID=3042318 RepID=UPI003A8061C6
MTKKLFLNTFALSALAIVMVSCNKEKLQSLQTISDTEEKVTHPSSAADKALVERIKGASVIIKEVLRNKDAAREIAALIKGGYYTDERVTIGDLLNPETSKAYKTSSYIQIKQQQKIFEGAFRKEYQRHHHILQVSNYQDSYSDIVLYFPYSEVFNLPEDFTIVTGEVDANSWPGIVIDANEEYPVLVNDDYAYQNPTIIVTSGTEVAIVPTCANPAWCLDPLPIDPNINIRKVQVGWVRTKDNNDKLVSFSKMNGGGNEIAFGRTSGYLRLDSDGQVSNFTNFFRHDFTRLDGRTKVWRPEYTVWDSDWKAGNTQQVFTVWEEDTKGCFEITGKISTKIKTKINGVEVEAQGEIGYKHNICAEDGMSYQQPFEWNAYVAEARNQVSPLGWDLKPTKNNALFTQFLFNGFFNFSSGTARDKAYLPNGESWPIVNLGYAADITWPYQIVR